MIDFLKSFLSHEKSAEENALLARVESERRHDVMRINTDDSFDDEEDWTEENAKSGSCHTNGKEKSGGCGGCGCG